MKFVVLIPDGSADRPLPELGGRTPLEAAATPNFDAISSHGRIGTVATTPPGFPAASDVSNMSILGYDPVQHYTGRAPIEAAALRIPLGAPDWAFRMNLVTLANGAMADYSAGHISTEEAARIVETLSKELAAPQYRMHVGLQYRHILVWSGVDWTGLETYPPHDIAGEWAMPKGPQNHKAAKELTKLMDRATAILAEHPVNLERRTKGLPEATHIWPWGQGRACALPSFRERHGIRGAVITAVDLIRGLGVLSGLDLIQVPGATGYLDTDYAAKGRAAIAALDRYDFLYVHIEAPDEASHTGEVRKKIAAIEAIDQHVAGPLWNRAQQGGVALMVLPDHATSTATKGHLTDPVPCAIYRGPDVAAPSGKPYTEAAAREEGPLVEQAHTLIDLFLGKDDQLDG